MPVTTPPVASVATKEGTRSWTCTIPLISPNSSPAAIATGNAASPSDGSNCASTTLASDATAWIDRSMPPSRMTKVTPVARMNSTAVLARRSASVSPLRKPGAAMPIATTRPTNKAGGMAP